MTNHRSRLLRAAAVPAVALALTLSACGSDDGDNGDNGGDTTQDSAEENLDDDPADGEDEDDADDEGDQDDAAGGGGDAHEQFEGMDPVLEGMSFGDFAGPIAYEGAELWVKVDRVDEGEHADWPEDAFSDPEDIAGMKPVYPYLTVVHTGGDDLEAEAVIRDTAVLTEDGDYADSIILMFADMPGSCEVDRDHDFSLGVEETQCEIGAIAEDAEVGEVHFYTDEEQLVWTP